MRFDNNGVGAANYEPSGAATTLVASNLVGGKGPVLAHRTI
jgi:hypothetical protein